MKRRAVGGLAGVLALFTGTEVTGTEVTGTEVTFTVTATDARAS